MFALHRYVCLAVRKNLFSMQAKRAAAESAALREAADAAVTAARAQLSEHRDIWARERKILGKTCPWCLVFHRTWPALHSQRAAALHPHSAPALEQATNLRHGGLSLSKR